MSASVAVSLERPVLAVELVDDEPSFAALRSEWTGLLRSSDGDTPFLTWEWLHAWWVHLRDGSELRLLTIRRDRDLVALAPLRLLRGGVSWLSRFEFLGTGHAGSDYLDVIVRRGYEHECAGALAHYLASRDTAIRLDRVSAGATATHLATALRGQGWEMSQTSNGVCPIIRLAGHSWNSYLATLGSAHRANVRRRLRALDTGFTTRFDRVTSEEQRREALDALIRFHGARFGNASTAFVTGELRAFHDDVTRRMLASSLRMYVLRLNDTPAAVMYGFLHNHRFYFYQHGFDDQFRHHSVGLALMALTIRTAIDEGANEFDMLWGVEPYKWLWARETRPLHQIHLFPAHVGGTLHRHAVQARRRLGGIARRVIPRGVSSGT